MKNLRIMQIGLSVGVMLCFSIANAALTGVSGDKSSEETAATIIVAPSHVVDDNVTNTGMQGFNEAQNVATTQAYDMDYGEVLAAGSFVDSHMIFLNPVGNELIITQENVTYVFSGDIIGVMSDLNGVYEAESTDELWSNTTIYKAPFSARGMEKDNDGNFDDYSFSGNVLTVRMKASTPGDWIRVVSMPAETTTIPGVTTTPYVPLLLLQNNNE